MTDIKPLEFLYGENGMTINQADDLLLGEYDITLGTEVKFYIHNPNENLICNVSQLKATHDNYTFIGPESGFVNPKQTVQVSIRIQPVDNIEKLGVEPLKSPNFPTDHSRLEGTVRWDNAR